MRNTPRSGIRYADDSELSDLIKFFESIDDDFFPPLTERDEGIEDLLKRYFDDGKVAVLERAGKLVAVSGYTYDKDDEDVAILELIGVAKAYRKSLAAYRLIKYMVQQESEENIKKIRAYTWSTNEGSRNLMEGLGFKVVETEKGHLHPDRTTIYYEIPMEDLRGYFESRE